MEATARDDAAAAGITFLPGIEYVDDPGETYLALDEARARRLSLPDFRVLPPGELPPGARWGCAYRTWCVNPAVYCCFLLRRFGVRGGRCVRREVREPRELFALPGLGAVAAVVNCSGIGFGDDKVFVTRGTYL